MITIKGVTSRALAAAILVGGFGPLEASATDYEQLANRIKSEFGVIYKNGRLGNDWCFNVQTEPGYTWWYYQLAGESALTARQIRQTARIQATYKNVGDQFRRYSSIFLGLEGLEEAGVPFKAFDLNAAILPKAETRTETRQTAATADTPPDPNVLIEPPASRSECVLKDFLPAYFLPYAPALGELSAVRLDTAGYRYWTFAGRAHQVGQIGSYPLTITVGGQPKSLRLIVGFGGGAGP